MFLSLRLKRTCDEAVSTNGGFLASWMLDIPESAVFMFLDIVLGAGLDVEIWPAFFTAGY